MGLILLATLALQPAEEPIDGRWVNPGASVIIDIGPCGDQRCGVVKWASDKAKADATKGVEQLVGSELLTGLHKGKRDQWQGKLFVPDRRVRVKAKLIMVDDQHIKVSGCTIGLLCKSQIWTRSAGELPD